MGYLNSPTNSQENRKEYFIGIDSDGCVFNTMEIKQKECFCPMFIKHFELNEIAYLAAETWEFVNLYSKNRGCNRFLAVLYTIDLLQYREEIKFRKIKIPKLNGLRSWIKNETSLGNPSLKLEIKKNNDPDLKRVYNWSIDVNNSIAKTVKNSPTFPFLIETLKQAEKKADLFVVSQTPSATLEKEWKKQGIKKYVHTIAGQEMGTKFQQLKYLSNNKYSFEKILMIGDAPGDLFAAKEFGALFFPIIPEYEKESWQLFYNQGLDNFLTGSYKGIYEDKLINKFNNSLQEKPSWKVY